MDGPSTWLRALFRRRREEAELEEEVRFHLEMEAEKLLRAGWAPDDARREAYRRFGGVERMKERTREARGTGWVEGPLRDLRYGLRSLTRSPGFAAVAVVTLALGIGATTASFSVVKGVLLDPVPWPGADRMVQVWEDDGGSRRYWPSYPNFVDWRGAVPGYDAWISTIWPGERTVLGAFEPAQVPVMGVSRGFFRVLDVPAVVGRTLADGENRPGAPPAVVVSHGFWSQRLGAPADLRDVTVEMDGEVHRVVGVLPAGFRFFMDADVYWPHERTPNPRRGAHAYRTFARLAPGWDADRAEASLDAAIGRMRQDLGDEMTAERAFTLPLEEVLLGSHREPLWSLLGASAFVLLVACVNLAMALLARGMGRRRELAVRASLGAGRGRILRQLLVETLLLAAAGGAAGVALARLAVAAAARAGTAVLPRLDGVTVDLPALGVAGAATVGSVLLFGVLPALRATRSLAPALRSGGGGTDDPGRTLLWRALLAGEAALTVLLLVGGALLLRSLGEMVGRDYGFDPEGVLTAQVSVPEGTYPDAEARAAFFRRLLDDVRALPGVEVAGAVNYLPVEAYNRSGGVRPEGADDRSAFAEWRIADPEYFRALAIDLVEGRLFVDGAGGATEAVVSRGLAERLWPEGGALGSRLRASFDPRDEWLTVVGVVDEARLWTVPEGSQHAVYVPWSARPEHTALLTLAVRAAGGDPGALAAPVRERVRRLGDRASVRTQTLASVVAGTQADRRFVIAVLVAFAVAALVLALVGVYGVVSYTVSRRIREVGIRLALGAGHRRVQGRLIGRTLATVAAGIGVGIPASLLLSRTLESLLVGVRPADPVALAGAVGLLLAAAALAAWIPVRRTRHVHPSTVLRAE